MSKFTWILNEGKFLSRKEVKKLQAVVEDRKEKALVRNNKTAVRDWFVINLGLHTGLRVEEMSELKHEDLDIENCNSSLIVKYGKNGKSRLVKFSKKFKAILLEYLDWKVSVDEPSNLQDPLIYSTNSKGIMSTRGLQKIFERSAKRAGIKGHSIHHLRHTYASHLYKASGYNLRMVQKQLGHSNIKITEVYADVLQPDLDRAINNIYR